MRIAVLANLKVNAPSAGIDAPDDGSADAEAVDAEAAPATPDPAASGSSAPKDPAPEKEQRDEDAGM